MAALQEAIEAAVRAAFLGWTEAPSGSGRNPQFLSIPVEESRDRPVEEPPGSRPRPTRVVAWAEILEQMEAATDISTQVQAELRRTEQEPSGRAASDDIPFLPAPRPSAA
jgi:hypothetical protein